MAAKKRKGRVCLLSRGPHFGDYLLTDLRGKYLVAMCPGPYNRTAEPSARLKPGRGVIRVRVTIEAE